MLPATFAYKASSVSLLIGIQIHPFFELRRLLLRLGASQIMMLLVVGDKITLLRVCAGDDRNVQL